MPDTAAGGYLLQHLTYHLKAAGLDAELDKVCCDLRFMAVRLSRSGPAAVESDLARSAAPAARRLQRAFAADAYLLRPIDPPSALTTILTSRLGNMPEVVSQLPALRSSLHVWTAEPSWPLPDEPADQRMRRVFGHKDSVWVLAISPDGAWIATTGLGWRTRTWDADGTPRGGIQLARNIMMFEGLAISPDGSWIASGSNSDGRDAQILSADLTARHTLTGHRSEVRGVAISPDGTWIATASSDRTARIWDADGTPRAILTGHTHPLHAVAISPDGSWIATASSDRTARIWDADGTPRATLTGHTDEVRAVAISPDGSWIATASSDRTARIWDADGTPRATLTGHTWWVRAVAISPDGSRIATASDDGTARIWDAALERPAIQCLTAIRIVGGVHACGWFPAGSDLCLGGDWGIYRFTLRAPDE